MTTTPKTVELSGIQRHFGEPKLALDDVSFSIAPGEVVGLLGRNGAGKTTLIKIVLGMLHPHRGTVRVFGLDPAVSPVEVKRRIGYVADGQLLPPYLRARDVFAMHAELFPTWDDAIARELTERFEIRRAKKIQDMSKGEARRVAVTAAISHRPELLLLDEPASGFDPAARREFLEIALEHLEDTGSAILFSSHQLDDVERMASRICVLRGSRLVLDESLAELQESVAYFSLDGDAQVASTLRGAADFLSARVKDGVVQGIARGNAHRAAEMLRERFARAEPSTRAARLEEVFIELTETDRVPRKRTMKMAVEG